MIAKLDYYRIYVPLADKMHFIHALATIRPDESKIQRIDEGSYTSRIDITVSEEELTFLKLVVAGVKVVWIQEWNNDNDKCYNRNE